MSKTNIMNTLSRSLGKTKLGLKKHAPEILVITGVIGTVTSAVMACKATTKAGAIIDEMKDNMEKIHEVAESTEITNYSEEDMKKDTIIVYSHMVVDMIKLYGPSIILGTLSITSILAGNNILRKRNLALAAAYAGIDKSFKEYRNRVVERFGKELDKELRYNIKATEVEEITLDEKGNEVVEKKMINVADPNTYSDYARFFDDGCAGWSKSPEDNLTFLKAQQAFANQKLQWEGHLFLNDVYRMLGIPTTKAGQVVGWIYDEKNPIGDNFVDFGLYDINRPVVRDFVNGYERTILLDFNVDGNILDLM